MSLRVGQFTTGSFHRRSRVVLPPDRRIELLPMHDGGPRQLLSVTETQEMVKKWAEARTPRATCTDDVGEFVHAQTAGHAGIVYDLLKETLDVKVLPQIHNHYMSVLANLASVFRWKPESPLRCPALPPNPRRSVLAISYAQWI